MAAEGAGIIHAVHVSVEIDAARSDIAQKILKEITVPLVKSQPGFVRGTWVRSADGSRGRGLVLFENEEHANALVAQIKPPDGAPITITSIEVYEVLAEA